MKIELYVDGSAKNNGAKENNGGFGVVVLIKDENKKCGFRIDTMHSEQINNTTNNRMELSALLYALALTQTKYKDNICVIKSDSTYCVNIFNDWIYGWERNGWIRQKNKTIENLDLIKQIWEYRKINFPNFIVEKVQGHAGVLGNEIADALANNDEVIIKKLKAQLNENNSVN